jgi:hypothetical protein
MAARNKCLAGNNKSGPVRSDARLGTSDEPVQALARRTGEQGSAGARHRPLNGRFCDEAKPCSDVLSLSLTVRCGPEEQNVSAGTKERDGHR